MDIFEFGIEEAEELYKPLLSQWYGSVSIPINKAYFYKGIGIQDKALCILYKNPHLPDTLLVGNFECVDDGDVFDALFHTWLKQGCKKIIGPINGSTWDEYRTEVWTSGFERFISEPLQKKYYPSLWTRKMTVDARYLSTLQENPKPYAEEKIEKIKQQHQDISFRNIKIDDYENELKLLYRFCVDAFADNYLYTPISEQEFISKYLRIKPILREEWIKLAIRDDELIAFNFSYLSGDYVVMKTVACKRGRANMGLSYILGNEIIHQVNRNQLSGIIHAYILDTNVSKNLSDKYGTKTIRQYHLYSYTQT
jgi:hypothetical protein